MFTESGDDLGRFLAMRLPSRADAEDLAQETYLRLLRVERSDLVRRPEALLYRIASNLVYEYYLKRSHREKCDTEFVEGSAGAGQPTAAHADARRRIARLEKVTASLSPKCRAALIMARRDGMTYAEIAARLGISTSMVKKYLKQAHALCRKRMKDEYREHKQ
ncbi:MAG: sigma-70 family RNA polymerase sigma factor [Woeseia sp.]